MKGDVDRVRVLLDAGADIDQKDKYGQTALMHASRLGHIALVRLLVERDADLNVTAKYNLSALMLAVINGHTGIVQILATAGADFSVRGGKGAGGFCGKTALTLAEEAGRSHMVTLLREAGATE